MKNFTPFGRLLLLAVFLLSAVCLSAQTVCGINGPVTISAEPACQSGFPSPQPFVVVDLGPGSGLINGPVNVTVQPVYNNIFPGPPVEAIGVIANNGFIAFETPENSVFAAFNIKIRLIEITIVGSCTQNFEINPIESAPFSMQETSRVQSVTKNTTRSIDPPCPGIATGRISANLVPTSGPFTATRFSAEIYPPNAFIQVFGPSSGPNNDPNSYLIETTAALEAGNYDIVISDNQSTTGCVVVYNAVVGDPSTTLTAETMVQNASCFGVADGSITVGVNAATNPQVNGTIFVEYSIGNGAPIQAGPLPVNNMTNQYGTATISGLATGSYNVNLTSSATGCSDDADVFIFEPAEIVVTASADPVCADAGTFDFTLTGVSGLEPNAQYRLIDASFFDPSVANNGCWTRPSSGRDPIAPGLQMDGSYRFTNALASTPGCYNINQDTLVTLYLELRNPNGCRDTFSFPLQINAKPITPVVTATANVGGSLINDFYCSGQDIDLDIADYDPAFTYEITYTELPGVMAGGAAALNDTFPYVDGSTVVSFMNNTDFLATIEFLVTKTDAATGCTSAAGSFSTRIRPETTVDPIFNNEVVICSAEQFVSDLIEVNGSNNGNITYNFAWTLTNPSPAFTFNGQFTGNQDSNTSVSGTFTNTTGSDQTATLTITPVFVQQNTVVGGGTVDNTCEGESETITVTVSSRPTLTYDLTIGDLDTMLTGGNVAAFEICNGEDFLLDNLAIPETHAGGKLKYVRYRVRGDARFLQIRNTPGATGFGPDDIQTTQFLPIDNFAIGQPNILNNHPNNNAQVAQITLTPYYQTPGAPANLAASQMCAGQRIRLFLTVNPTPPVLPSPQSETVCSDERIEYTIMGASGNGSTLETRITAANVFSGTTDATFVVPEGANRIEDFRFELTGGNGGGTTTTGGSGGFGAFVTGSLSSTELLPGDVVRIRKGLAGGANNRNGKGGDATFLTVSRSGMLIDTFVAAGGGGAGSGMNGRNARTFTSLAAANGIQGQGPGGFGGTGFGGSPVARGGNGNVNGGGGGGGWVGGNGGNSQSGQSGQGGASYRSATTVPASFAQKTATQLADGQARIFYTVVYDDIRFSLASQNVPAGLTPTGESIVDGEVDTILFGQQFENLTNDDLTVTYVFNTSTEAMCENGGQVTVNVTVEPKPTATIASGSTTTVSGNATDGYTATVCSGDSINAILNSLTRPSEGIDQLYFEVSTTSTAGTNIPGNATGAASNTPRFDVINTGLPIDFFERRVVNNTGADGTITYTITPYIGANMPSMRSPASAVDCVGDPITFTVTVQPGFNVSTTQPVVDVCSREALNAVFDLDASQAGSINIAFDQIRIEGFRVSNPSADFTLSGLDTTGLAAGGFLLNRTGNFFNDANFTNRTGGGVGVEIDVVFISDTGCESVVVTYPFNVRAEPIIDESNTAITICEGEATGLSVMAAANSAFFNNFAPNDVTFSYTLDEGVMTHTGATYPISGVDAFRFQNDAFDNPTSTPQTATYTVVATSRFGCASQPVTYTVTVEPSPELTVTASQGSSSITGEVLLADIETLTICSGSTVNFALSQDVTGTGVSYRIQRVVNGTVTNGNGSPVDNFEGGLAVGGFQETLANTSTVSATVQYNLAAYTYGRNGMDDDGLNASDDCQGVTKRLIVEVLPATTDEASLRNNLTVNNPNVGPTNPGNGAQICDNSEVLIRPVTTIDPTTGAAFIWRRENDGTLLGGATSGSGGFNTTLNGNNVYPAPNSDRIQQVLTAQDGQTTEVRYIVTLYSFGSDGVDDMLAPGSDDCPGDIDTVTVQLDPTPVITADLEIGTAPVVSLNAEGSRYIYEICSGEDFLLGNLAFPETSTGKAKYVEFSASGQTDFLGLPQGGPSNFYSTVAPVNNFSLGTQNVQNTSGNNSAQTAFLTLIPYFEDGNNDTSRDAAECAGEPILITVTINPAPPAFAPLTETVCSDEEVSYTIPGASNQGVQFRSRVAGSTTFDGTNDFVVPIGAAAIRAIDITVNGANGGTSAGNRGGLGGVVETSLNPFPIFPSMDPTLVFPGDTIRVRKGVAGADGTTNGGGGDASFLCIIAGPNSPFGPPGAIVETLLAGGGGGAGFAESGADAGAEQTSAASDGANGNGLGGFGGTGWDPMNPQAGSFGGAGRGNGGGGGGGWNGGDGGSNLNGLAGGFGTSYTGMPMMINQVNADFFTKGFSDAAGGSVRMDYTLVYNDVQFTLTNLAIGAGLTSVSPDPLTVGDTDTDTILFGEQFLNDTDAPVDVVYTFSTSSEANCPGGEVTVTLTVEPNPTLDLASNGTMITDNGDGTYAADICSGDSLSAVLSSMTIPSQGTSVVRARVIDVERSSMEVTFGTGDGGEASASVNLNGNNQPSTNDLPFYEASISNVGDTNGTVTYTVVPYIINTVGSSGVECVGDTLTLTVTVYPEFVGVDEGPIMTNICSNVSLGDAGFDLDATQPVQIGFDSIIIDNVTNTAGGNMNFETISSVYSGTPVTLRRSEGFFNGDFYRNRTGGPVFVTYTVRLVSGPGCTSEPITYEFRYTAEPVIDIVESASNQIDTTICSMAATGIVVNPAANSAFSNPTDFNNNITLEFDAFVPAGIVLTNGTYPATGDRFLLANDELENTTDAPLDVVYTVTPFNGTCPGRAVNYVVTVNPNPFADVTLTSLDSTETFGLDNSRLFVSPNPQFGVCSGQALTATVPSVSAVATGMLMVNFEISADANGISGYPAGVFTFPASELADSLSYAAGELVNMTGAAQFFTVEYRAYIEANGTPGFQNDGVDCQSDGIIQFDVVVNPTNTADVTVRFNDGSTTAIPSGQDTLCSGEVFDLAVKALNNNPNPQIDSFVVTVDIPTGIETGPGTFSTDTTLLRADFSNVPAQFTRLLALSFTNATPGTKTVTYTATPYTMGCAGIPDTTTISFRPVADLEFNEPVICAQTGVSTAIFPVDANGQILATANNQYRYRYIGGDASGFSLTRANGTNFQFIGDPVNQANTITYNNEQTLIVTPAGSFMPGVANFEVLLRSTPGGCGQVLDTLVLELSADANAGTLDPSLDVLCDGVNFLLSEALMGESEGGVFTDANGTVQPGGNFTPMIGGSDPAPVSVSFTYTVGGGNSGCTVVSNTFSVMVEPAPNAGTYVGTPGEACESAPAFNLFDLLTGEMQNGTFTQTAGVDFVTVNPDGTIDQDNITPGMYEFTYTVTSANGCGSDVTTGIAVQVNSLEDCSTVVPCDVITLTAGFNVISFDVIPNDNTVRAIFANEIASRNLVRVIAVNPGVDNGNPQAFSYVSLIDSYVGNISGGIQGGYGYIVEVETDATVEVCGTAVDPNLRIALQANLNIVGYVPQTPESVDSYFSEIIANGELNRVRTVQNGAVQNRVYGVFPFPVGPLTTMRNGLGYIVDVDAAYAAGSWRDAEGITTTSNFDQYYGRIENGEELVGQEIQFVDDLGNVYGETVIREGGIYYNAFAFGDLESTEEVTEGFTPGADIFVMIDGERYATDAVFGGNWAAIQVNVELPGALTPTFEETALKFAMNVYPNPTPGPVTVNFAFVRNYNIVHLEVFNTYGQLVLSRKLEAVTAGRQTTEIDFTGLPAGAYQLRVMTDEGLLGNRQIIRR